MGRWMLRPHRDFKQFAFEPRSHRYGRPLHGFDCFSRRVHLWVVATGLWPVRTSHSDVATAARFSIALIAVLRFVRRHPIVVAAGNAPSLSPAHHRAASVPIQNRPAAHNLCASDDLRTRPTSKSVANRDGL